MKLQLTTRFKEELPCLEPIQVLYRSNLQSSLKVDPALSRFCCVTRR